MTSLPPSSSQPPRRSADIALRNRASMSLLGVGLMVISAVVMFWLGQVGVASSSSVAIWIAVALSGSSLLALMVCSGFTCSWRDPSLSLLQILWSITVSAFAYVIAGQAKGIVPGLLAVTLLFAALNLRPKQIIVVSFYTLGVYAVAVLFALKESTSDRSLEIIYGVILLNMLLGCMFLSLRLHQLRKRLQAQREELASALEANKELASRDPLTGLLNRRNMLELMHLEQRRCMRGVRSMLLVQMDLDHFKSINDTYGHGVGDQALKTFANVVRSNIRGSDVLSRWGGEEFVLLFSDACVDGAMQTLNRVRMAVSEACIDPTLPQLRMTVSMGLAEHLPGESVESTLDRADKALYSAKRAGRNQVVQSAHPISETMAAKTAMPSANSQTASWHGTSFQQVGQKIHT